MNHHAYSKSLDVHAAICMFVYYAFVFMTVIDVIAVAVFNICVNESLEELVVGVDMPMTNFFVSLFILSPIILLFLFEILNATLSYRINRYHRKKGSSR